MTIVTSLLFGGLLGALAFDSSADDNDLTHTAVIFGGTGFGADTFHSSVSLLDGFVSVGESPSNSFGTGDWIENSGQGSTDAIIVKYDFDGNIEWKRNFGGSNVDIFYGVTVVSDGIIAVGISYSGSFDNGDWSGISGRGGNDAIIVKYDFDGNIEWKRNFGGAGDDRFSGITALSDGIIVVGYSGSASFNNGDWSGTGGRTDQNAIAIKYDFIGNIVWKRHFGGTGDDQFKGITTVLDGFIVVGDSDQNSFNKGDWSGISGRGGIDAIIVKYNLSGTVVWKQNFGGASHDYFNGVTAFSDGFVTVGSSLNGSFNNGDWSGISGRGGEDAIIAKFDLAGGVLWKNNFGGAITDVFRGVVKISDGFVAVGNSVINGTGDWIGNSGRGGADGIFVKYDFNGNVILKQNFGGANYDYFNGVTAFSNRIISVGYSAHSSLGNGDWIGVDGGGYAGYLATVVIWNFPESPLGIDITSVPPESGIVGTEWFYIPDFNIDDVSFIVSGADWLNVVDGMIFGVPVILGDYTITIVASADGYTSADQTFTLSVYPVLSFITVPSGVIITWGVP